MEYLKRVYDDVLLAQLRASGAVLIEGPKWCGKTTTALQHSGSVLYLANPRDLEQNRLVSELNPGALLAGRTPRLIDEWQVAPKLWDAVRFEVDQRQNTGQFILTGSTTPVDITQLLHSGTGRIARMRMRTMSLYESECPKDVISLRNLFDGSTMPVLRNDYSLEDIAGLLCRGGWPSAARAEQDVGRQQATNYVDSLVEQDMPTSGESTRNPAKVRAFLRSYARSVATATPLINLARDADISETTARDYLSTLQQLFVVEELPAWNPNLRSKTAIRTSPVKHFTDPSLAAAALGAGVGSLLSDLNTFGLLFESLCIRDLRALAAGLDGQVYHFRDSSGLECDAVVVLRDGRYGLIEAKLGGETLISEGANSLNKLASRLDTERMPSPSFRLVLTASDSYSLTRPDGVQVAPIGLLGL